MELFWQTTTIMTLGMALVFLFLFIVIQCMNFTAFMVRRHAAAHPVPTTEAADKAAKARVVAAIAAATDLTPTPQ
jgi:sodium pump decarboxylase gamma subunit